MKTVCAADLCAGCMACVDVCNQGAIQIVDTLSAYNAVIDEEKCVSCGRCYEVCHRNNPATLAEPIWVKQGYAADEEIRGNASSGGFASAIEKAFAKNGGVVYSCTFNNGAFIFEKAEKASETDKFSGSKYVKSNPTGVYKQVRGSLKDGKKVLFVGLPCQVAALKRMIPENLQEQLYTMDLICHGTPSPQLLEMFLNQHGSSLQEINNIRFRAKERFRIEKENQPLFHHGVTDRYMIAFLNTVSFTENCYHCEYAQWARCSDVTLGDSWGSALDESLRKKGVSLALCQTEKGKELLQSAKLVLFDVDIEKAVANNGQLKTPSKAPKVKDLFFKEMKAGKNFDRLVAKMFFKQSLKQDIKRVLYRMKLLRGKYLK